MLIHNHAAPLILGNVCDDCTSYLDSLNCSGTADRLISEYLTRTDRLARNQRLFFRKLHYPNKYHNGTEYDNLQGVKDMELAYESPQNLAAELSKSILYSDVEINDKIKDLNLNSLNVDIKNKDYSDDSLWNGKPQQYFESMNNEDAFGDSINVNEKIESEGEFDSLARFP